MTSNNLNSSPQLCKGLVTDVPSPMCNGCSGTLTCVKALVDRVHCERSCRIHMVEHVKVALRGADLLNFVVSLLVIFGFLDVINVFDIGNHWVSSLLICNKTD